MCVCRFNNRLLNKNSKLLCHNQHKLKLQENQNPMTIQRTIVIQKKWCLRKSNEGRKNKGCLVHFLFFLRILGIPLYFLTKKSTVSLNRGFMIPTWKTNVLKGNTWNTSLHLSYPAFSITLTRTNVSWRKVWQMRFEGTFSSQFPREKSENKGKKKRFCPWTWVSIVKG